MGTGVEEPRHYQVHGDKFAGGWHSNEWLSHGITFIASETTTSENYLASLPVFLANRVRLVDNATLRNQLTSLERRTSAADRETVSHPQHASAHDDCATSVCGTIALLSTGIQYDSSFSGWSDASDPNGARAWDAMHWHAQRSIELVD